MKQIKLTLLIALSIIIFFTAPCFTSSAGAELEYIPQQPIIVNTSDTIEETNSLDYTVEKTEPSIEIIDNSVVSEEYPIAAKIWNRLKSEGFNNQVCAGIMGNIMAEVGGQTLDFSKWEYWSTGKHSGSYGICQWTQGRKKNLLTNFGSGIDEQLDFLMYDIAYEFNTYGNKYKKGFNYEKFCNMTNCKDAALAFAKCYERCGSGSYNVRKKNAEKAYSYFVK